MLRLLIVVSCVLIANISLDWVGNRRGSELSPISFLLTLGHAVDKELQLWFFKNGVKCSKEYPVTMQEFEDLKKHKIPDTKNALCLLACVFKKIKWMTDEGMFDDDAAYSLARSKYTETTKQENGRKLYDLCKKVNEEKVEDGAADCDRAKLLAKCLMQNSVKYGFLNPE